MNSSDLMSLVPVPIPAKRSVYRERIGPHDEIVYYAITSTGALLNDELRRRLPDEAEATLARELWRELNARDPEPIRPRLFLCR